MMKILFVAPSFPGHVKEYLILPSLELCILSSILKEKGHTVNLLDMKINSLDCDAVNKNIEPLSEDYDFVLIEDSPETHCNTVKLVVLFRQLYPAVKIILRGEIPSFIPEEVISRNPNVDFITRFDDDYALLRIIEESTSCDPNYNRIPNIAFNSLDGAVVTQTQKRSYALDDLPRPDRKLYDVKKYLKRDSETIVRSTRGCPGNCLFCIKTRYEEFSVFSIQRFVDEIEELLEFGFESFFFSDDTFAFSDSRVEEVASEIEKRNLKIRFTSNIRVRDINDFKISRLKSVGAYRVFVGIETINATTSTVLKKNITEDFIKEKIKILKKYNMEFHASFILGAPNDTPADLEKTITFVKEIKPTIVTFNLIKIYPGLPLYDNPKKYGMIMDDPFWFEKDEWSRKCIMGTNQLPPEELEKWSRRMLFEFISL